MSHLPPPPPKQNSLQTRGHTLGTTNVAGLHFRYISLVPTTSENKTNKRKKKKTENVVMINGRSNDGH